MLPILFDEKGFKICKKCKLPKKKEDYYKSNTYKSGFRPECIECCGELGKKYPKTKDQVRESRYKNAYGITLEEYNKMFVSQGGVCCICKLPETRQNVKGVTSTLAVDHDHETGEVRGLLCGHCNQGLGHFKDNTENLLNAAIYLEKNRLKKEIK